MLCSGHFFIQCKAGWLSSLCYIIYTYINNVFVTERQRQNPKTRLLCEPKNPNLTCPFFYLFPRQGDKPPPPLLAIRAYLMKTDLVSGNMQLIFLSFRGKCKAAAAVTISLYLCALLSVTLSINDMYLRIIILFVTSNYVNCKGNECICTFIKHLFHMFYAKCDIQQFY